jgi:hypothetical protein
MKGLIFNLLADLARRAGCEDDAWHVALSVSEEVSEELALDDNDEDLFGMLTEASLQGGADFTFRWLMRSGTPFCDEDWVDLSDQAPISTAGRGSEPPDGMYFETEASRRRPNRD